MKKFKSLRKETNLDEAFGMFVVPIPKQTLNGKKIGGESITVKARTAREAIQKAAKQLGVDFKFLKTGKVTKESVDEALKNPYKKFSERDLKRKLTSFETQLADLIKKSNFRKRKDLEPEIRDMETKVQQVKAALKENMNESYTSLLTIEINEGLSPALKKAQKLMGPSKTKDQGIEFVMKGMKVDKKKATQMVDQILKMKESINESGHTDVASMKQKVKVAMMAIQKMNQELSKLPNEGDLPTWWTNKVAIAVDKLDGMSDYLDTQVESVTEANMSDVKKQLGKVKGLSKDAYNQLVALPMPVLTTMVNQLSGIVSSTQVESVNENVVMGGQFKSGDIPSSDLYTSIEQLKIAKKKAEGNRSKVSDPVLVKSLEGVIKEIDKTIKDAEKVEAAASKAIAKVSSNMKKTFDLINKKKYLIDSTEVEDDVIEEAMGAFPQVGSKFALKKKHVKMIQDIIKSKGNAAANHIQSKMGYSKSAAQDLIDLAQGRAIYGKKLGMTGSGVVESLKEQLGLQEAFAIEKGAKVKIKHSKNKDLYGTVVKGVETKGFKVNGKQGILVRWSNKVLGAFEVDQFAVAHMDRKADYVITDDGVRFDN